jgi:hypothetical protein
MTHGFLIIKKKPERQNSGLYFVVPTWKETQKKEELCWKLFVFKVSFIVVLGVHCNIYRSSYNIS